MENVKLMSSYIVYRELSKKKLTDHYEILAVFIEYLINNAKLDNIFKDIEVKDSLIREFGFDVPISAIKISLKRIASRNIIIKSNKEYNVINLPQKQDELFDRNFDEVKQMIFKIKQSMNDAMSEDEIAQELYYILINGELKNQVDNQILIYLYNNKENDQLQRVLTKFKEGFLLSTGVTYNIIAKGYIKEELKIFLSTEIIFFLMGYSGEYKNKMAIDFLKNLKEIDKYKKVKLMYFSDTKREIESFFAIAKDVCEGKRKIDPTKDIVRNILIDVSSIEDVVIKQSDLFYNLKKKYGISEDLYDKYYEKENNDNNLEYSNHNFDGDPADVEQSQKFISNINKLRKTDVNDVLSSKAIYITNKSITLRIDEILRRDASLGGTKDTIPYCLSLSDITNIFWCSHPKTLISYKPYNVDCVANINLALQNVISVKAAAEYENVKKEFEDDNDENKYRQRIELLNEMSALSTSLNDTTDRKQIIFAVENLSKRTDSFFSEMEKLKAENEMYKKLLSEKNTNTEDDQISKTIDAQYAKMDWTIIFKIKNRAQLIKIKAFEIFNKHRTRIIVIAICIVIYVLYTIKFIPREVLDFLSYIK